MNRAMTFLVATVLALGLMLGARGATTLAATNAGYPDFSYQYTGVSAPTGEKPQSKLWYNDGRWWGSLFNVASASYHIYWLNTATQQWNDTGTTLDPRPTTKADCLWDEAANKLYVASGGMSSGDGQLFRYSYNPNSKSYSLDVGFPVTIRSGSSETLVLDKDSTGQLWITYTKGSKVYVNRSLGSDTSWGAPFTIPAASVNVNVAADDISSLIAFDGKIGVLWSNQSDSTFYFAIHDDADSDTTWTGGIAARQSGTPLADDHISLKSLQADSAGNVFAVVKTSINGSSTTTPQIMVLARRSNGSWSSAMVSSGAENETRPILLIDTDHRQLYVFSSDESGGSVYYKQSSIDNIQFPSGKGTPFISNSAYSKINDSTSTKQNVNSATGIVVLASDDAADWYLHNYLSLNGAPPPSPTASATNGPTATATATATPPTGNRLLNPGFELDANADGRPDSWSSNAKFTRSNANAHSGSFAGRHQSTSNSGYTISQSISQLSAGQSYQVGGWVNIPPTSDSFSYKLQVRWINPNNNTISTSTLATYTAATNGWQQTSATLVAPAGTSSAQVRMVISSLSATVDVDDLLFQAASGGPTNTPTATSGPTNTPTNTPTSGPTNTPTPTSAATNTPTPTTGATSTPTNTPSSGGTQFSFSPAADTYVNEASPSTSYASANQLTIVGGSGSRKQAFLRFTVSGLPAGASVQQAKLRLTVTNDSTSGGIVQGVSNTSWSEALTWASQPAIDGPVLANVGAVGLGAVVEIDVSSVVVGNGSYSVAIVAPSGNANNLGYASREATSVSTRPQLIITTN